MVGTAVLNEGENFEGLLSKIKSQKDNTGHQKNVAYQFCIELQALSLCIFNNIVMHKFV
jgi:hypothetical protein